MAKRRTAPITGRVSWPLVVLFFIAITTAPSSSSSLSSSDVIESDRYGPLPPTVFAPNGRLYPVERTAARASDADDLTSPTVVALRCGGGGDVEGEGGGSFAVVVSTRPRSPHGYYGSVASSSSTSSCDDDGDDEGTTPGDVDAEDANGGNRHRSPLLLDDRDDDDDEGGAASPPPPAISGSVSILGPNLLVATGGNAIDCAVHLRRIQDSAFAIHRSNDGGGVWASSSDVGGDGDARSGWTTMAVDGKVLARRVADAAQVATQTVGGRGGKMLSSSAIVVGTKERRRTTSPVATSSSPVDVWRIDPTGQFWNCDAAAIGRCSNVVESNLLREVYRWKRDRGGGGGREVEDENERSGGQTGGEDEGEDDMERISASVTNGNVRECLSSLAVEDAVAVACRCIADALKKKGGTEDEEEEARNYDENDDDSWNDLRAVIVRPSPADDDESRADRSRGFLPPVQILSGPDLRTVAGITRHWKGKVQ